MKPVLIIILMLSIATSVFSQDIIVKTDKTEIKSRVQEITETVIKYKTWDNQNGPIYSLAKKDVFMIIYQNGQREIISKAPQPTTNAVTAASPTPVQQAKASDKTTDTINYKNLPIRYNPFRIMYTSVSSGGSSSGALGLQYSYRVIRNFMNVGVDYHYYISGVGSGVTVTEGALYIEPYLGLNRAMGDYQNQNVGLFINAKVGGGVNSVSDNATNHSTSTGGLFLGIGADYFFTDSFAISAGTYKLADFTEALQVGVTLKF